MLDIVDQTTIEEFAESLFPKLSRGEKYTNSIRSAILDAILATLENEYEPYVVSSIMANEKSRGIVAIRLTDFESKQYQDVIISVSVISTPQRSHE